MTPMDLPPDETFRLDDGRLLGFDDRGAPDGAVLMFFHGTPDTRLARHPDDAIVSEHGLRLIAADRPGLGGSDPDRGATPLSVAADHVALLDHLGRDQAHLVAWSAGAIFAAAFAGAHPDRVASLTLVAPLIPADAYDTPGVVDGANAGRAMFAEMAFDMDPDDAGRELAMWLVPPEVTEDVARELLAGSLKAVDGIDGAGDALVAAQIGSVAQGMTGLEREITAQAIALGPLLDAIAGPVVIHAAAHDDVCPPAMADWYRTRLSSAAPTVVPHPDAGHEIGITAWPEIVAGLSSSP